MEEKNNNTPDLIAALKKGDRGAFKLVYDANVSGLIAFVNGYTKNKTHTDDIVQETFIALWSVRKKLVIEKSIKGFLYKTAYNKFIDNYRKNKRETSMLDDLMYTRLMQLTKDNDELTAKKVKYMLAAIEKLPPKCKEIFVLSKYQHLKYSEIADKLNISIKTVESQMGRAFLLIRKDVSKSIVNLFLSISRFFK